VSAVETPGPKQGPKIVTSRFGLRESWTLASYLDNGGYEGLRRALAMTPEEVHQAALASSILGRGGQASTPAASGACCARPSPCTWWSTGTKANPPRSRTMPWSKATPPADRRQRHMRLRHRAAQVFIFVRGEMALAQERLQAALNEAYEHGAVGANILAQFLRRHRRPPRRRRLYLR